MPRGTQGRLLRALLVCTAIAALVPAAAFGETWTVDDDGAECPSATFSRIQDAVDQAAPRDTVVICAGVYEERSTPPKRQQQSLSQPGVAQRRTLTITKPLTLKGAGATKVRIRPAPSIGSVTRGNRAVPAGQWRERGDGGPPGRRRERRQRELRRHPP